MDVLELQYPNVYEAQEGPGLTVGHRNMRIVDKTTLPFPATRAVFPCGNSKRDAEIAKRLYVLFR